MTVSELYKQVAQLGFEDSLESDERFYYATNRALLQVNAIRPAIRSYSINHTPLENLLGGDMFEPQPHASGVDMCFAADGVRAYYFEADGNGAAHIEYWDASISDWSPIDGKSSEDSIALESSKTFKAYKGVVKADGKFVNGLVRLRLSGDFFYTFRNVALYGDVYSNDPEDVPTYEPYVRYDMSDICEDFLAFEGPPVRVGVPYETLNQDYDIEGNVLLLPRDASGSYLIRYKSRPAMLEIKASAEGDNTPIKMNEELASLLPCLIASYVLAEDEPSLAQYYLTLYREQIAIIDARTKKVAPVRIKRESGW